jgi:spore germination protein KB
MIRFMRSGSFLETMDPALIALWLVSIFVKISFVLFVASLALTHTLGLKDNKPLVFPLTAFIGIVSLILARSNVQFNEFMKGGLLTMLIVAELVPLLYLIVDTLRRSLRKPKGSEAS